MYPLTQAVHSVSSRCTDLVETAFCDGLQQLIGPLGFVSGHDSCRLGSQEVAAHQHHHIYGLLQEGYLGVLILERNVVSRGKGLRFLSVVYLITWN